MRTVKRHPRIALAVLFVAATLVVSAILTTSLVPALLVVKSKPAPESPAGNDTTSGLGSDFAMSRNNLKQIVLAMHNYHDTYGHMPPAVVYSKDGKTPLYSWRVELLPFIEEGDLYIQFHRDEPWNSEHNLALLRKMPAIYASPKGLEGQEAFTTFYQVFVGPQNEAPFEGNRQPKMPAAFADGTSNTFLIVESGNPVLWTKPEDTPYSSKGPLPKLGGIFKEGFNAALADGSVRFIKRTTSEKTIRAVITPAGGEILPPDWDQP
jgi:hypothetical protein